MTPSVPSISADTIRAIALMLPALLLSLSVHEFAHAWMANRLGDDTAERQGRLTLSPASHVDVFGTIIFPLLLITTTGGVFGWAKPVPFNPARFRRGVSMRGGAALTAAAGPLSNVALMVLCLMALFIAARVGLDLNSSAGEMLFAGLSTMIVLNGILAVFNLIPLPPLDGSYLLPRSMDDFKERISGYSFLILLAVFLIPLPGIGTLGGIILSPMLAALGWLVGWAMLPALGGGV